MSKCRGRVVMFKYQMHCHTSPCSGCAHMSPLELVNALHDGGYSGCVITNHFYNGNSGIDRSMLWTDFVGAYENDFLECKAYAKKYDIDFLFGIEEHFGNGREILCYGVTPEMLRAHPELQERNLKLWYETMSALGVVVVQAHPYRARKHISEVGPFSVEFLDGIEVYNYRNYPEENEQAKAFAEQHPDFILTSGSDAHITEVVPHAGIMTQKRIISEKELAAVLISREYTLIIE